MQQAQKEREEAQYPYSGSDDETPETQVAGEPSSILHGPGENTLRQNFQALQEHNKVLTFRPILDYFWPTLANLGKFWPIFGTFLAHFGPLWPILANFGPVRPI